ncbi:hypothetical protein [Pseudoxanthomonas sp. SE1]|uniref:hypothetical protein n=1 Tax=Pseudoxanthomonas sp. SE1 TaxID=1664560 RepID=UPI00240E8BCD|nr:hypothetical protein [Pseudoxanthomonas sp. SE1]WFC43787.1 hypothetical protein OY559_09955 [Pseudoxanthomonas sp. SE1]
MPRSFAKWCASISVHAKPARPQNVRDGYFIEEVGGLGMVAAYGTDEPGAVSNCRWYNFLTRGRRVFRVVLRVADHVAVIHG